MQRNDNTVNVIFGGLGISQQNMMQSYKPIAHTIAVNFPGKQLEDDSHNDTQMVIKYEEGEDSYNKDDIKTEESMILIPGSYDIRHNKRHLSRKANELYQQNKQKLLDAKTIEIKGESFGGLNAFAFLATISKDKTNGQEILDKITNIHLIDPLPNTGQSRIGKWTARFMDCKSIYL